MKTQVCQGPNLRYCRLGRGLFNIVVPSMQANKVGDGYTVVSLKAGHLQSPVDRDIHVVPKDYSRTRSSGATP